MTDNEQLLPSDTFIGEAPVRDYLFLTATGRIEFVIFEQEMAQLNDFCVVCLSGTAQKLPELRQELGDLNEGKLRIRNVDGEDVTQDVTTDMVMMLEQFEIPLWEDTQDFMVRAMCLILLSAFTEKGLKSLCVAFAPEGVRQPEKFPQGKVATYLQFLSNECAINFDEPPEAASLRRRCQEIRNDFAHGDWDDVRDQVSGVSLRESFAAIASLMYEIESEAY